MSASFPPLSAPPWSFTAAEMQRAAKTRFHALQLYSGFFLISRGHRHSTTLSQHVAQIMPFSGRWMCSFTCKLKPTLWLLNALFSVLKKKKKKRMFKIYHLFNHTFLSESQKHFFSKLSMQHSGVQSKSTRPFFLSQIWHARFQSSWLHHRSVSIELLPVVKNRLTSENNSQFILMSQIHFTAT